MFVIETMFHNGEPLGKIHEDLFAGEVTFKPRTGNKRLAIRKWRSVTACKKAVLKTYKKEGPLIPASLHIRAEDTGYRKHATDG